MVDKRRVKTLGEMTAYERWELPNIGADGSMETVVSEPVEVIKPLTAEDIEEIRQQAYKDGFEEGRTAGFEQGKEEGIQAGTAEGLSVGKEEGVQRGLEAAQVEVDNQKKQLSDLIAALGNPLVQQKELVQESVLNLVIALTRAVIHREITKDREIIARCFNAVLEGLPGFDEHAVLYANGNDIDVLEPLLSQLGSKFDLQVDPAISPGGLRLRTSNQLIDYTVEKRFQKTVQAMLSRSSMSDDGAQEIPSAIGSLSDYSSEVLDESMDNESVQDSLNNASTSEDIESVSGSKADNSSEQKINDSDQ